MKIQYEDNDFEIINYQSWRLAGEENGYAFRGPAPSRLEQGEYYTCLGPATTVGRYVDRPYSLLVEEGISCAGVNLGIPGAGASLYLQEENECLLELANLGKFVIVLVMSGRSHASSLVEPPKVGQLTGPQIMQRYRRLYKKNRGRFVQVVRELRESFVNDYIALAKAITVPKVLLYLSHNEIRDGDDDSGSFARFHGGFPHFVNRVCIDSVSSYFDDYVECVSSSGMPQRLYSRFTGKPVLDEAGEERVNNFYASPQMHRDATDLLIPVCREYL